MTFGLFADDLAHYCSLPGKRMLILTQCSGALFLPVTFSRSASSSNVLASIHLLFDEMEKDDVSYGV